MVVYHNGGLGDFVLSLPAIFRTVAARPAERLHFWGPPDRLLLLPRFLPPPASVLQFGHTLWGEAPHPALEEFLAGCSTLLAFGGRAPPTVFSRFGRARALPIAGSPEKGGLRVPAHHARQLDALGVPKTPTPWLPLWRRTVCPAHSHDELVLHPGSGDRRKNAPAELWAAVLTSLRKTTGHRVRLVLGPAEREDPGWNTLTQMADAVSPCDDLTGLLAGLSRASLFLGSDSGASHLSALLGVPTVVLFGPSDPDLWRPLGPLVGVVRTHAPCSPCTHGAPFNCRQPRCLERFSAQEIEERALGLLRRSGHTTQSIC